MAQDRIRDLHLFAMDSFLPLGMGVIHNAKTGGLKKVINVIQSNDPFLQFQIDGETSAKIVRDKIDQFFPGLGHPVVSVDVTIKENHSDFEINEYNSLVSTLQRIDSQLDKLRYFLENDIKK